MLRTAQRLLRPSLLILRANPALTRGARTRRTTPLRVPSSTQTTEPVIHDIDTAAQELSHAESIIVEASTDLVLLDHLNNSRPGTKTDKRYQKQKKIMSKLESSDDKTKALFTFLMKEASREVWNYPNPDELELDNLDDVKEKEKDLEKGMEYELKRSSLSNWNVDNQRYKRFEVLLRVLENLLRNPSKELLVPLEELAKLFEMAQYLEDDVLKHKTRYLSGKFIYDSRKVEFDPVNESLYIESLMEFKDNKEAERLLIKRADKVGQRWWYELLVVNYIEQARFDKAEEMVDTIKDKFGDYLDTRIYLLFINSYLRSKNDRMCEQWTAQFMSFVASRGFLIGKRQEPGLGATEEAALEYLNREDKPTKEEFLDIIASYLKSPGLISNAAQLVSFYLQQPTTSSEDVALKLVEFRLHYQTKILPLLSNMRDKTAVEYINAVFDEFRSLTPLQTEQADVMDDFFNTLGQVGGYERITQEMQDIVASEGKLTDKQFYNLISALLKGGREDDAYEVLSNLELSSARALELPESVEQFVIPPVNSYHYMPFIRHFGRSRRLDDLKKVLRRFDERFGVYNPALLTQLLNTFLRSQCYNEVIQLIHGVVMKDIHKQDEIGDYRRLYSTIWSCLKDLATVRKVDEKISNHRDFPDFRVVFLKMVEDRSVPSAKDYAMIVKAFVVHSDFYPLPCVIQYMGKVHKSTPTPELLRTIEKLSAQKNYTDYPLREPIVSGNYMEKLKMLQNAQQRKKSLDPFSPHRDDEDQLLEQTLKDLQPQDESPDAELLWRVALAKVMDVLESRNADEFHLKRVHEQFGLVYDMDMIFSPEK